MPTRSTKVIGCSVGALLLAASTASCGGGSGASCGVQPSRRRRRKLARDQRVRRPGQPRRLVHGRHRRLSERDADERPLCAVGNADVRLEHELHGGHHDGHFLHHEHSGQLPAGPDLRGREHRAPIDCRHGWHHLGHLLGQRILHLRDRGTLDVENSAGTYATAGTTLTLTATSGGNGEHSGPYCVRDSTMHLVTVDMSMAMAKITGDIVLTKQ